MALAHPFVAPRVGASPAPTTSAEASSGGKRKVARLSVAGQRTIGGVALGLLVCAYFVGRPWKRSP
ncbi:MAG: hypothetical protein ACHREM_20785 [Polyangiales bacterium]